MAKIGDNIEASVKGNILTLTIDMSKRGELSKSGKSISIASTRGNKEVAPGIIAGINVYTKND